MTPRETERLESHLDAVRLQRFAGWLYILASVALAIWKGPGAGLICFALGCIIRAKIPPPDSKLDKITGRD